MITQGQLVVPVDLYFELLSHIEEDAEGKFVKVRVVETCCPGKAGSDLFLGFRPIVPENLG